MFSSKTYRNSQRKTSQVKVFRRAPKQVTGSFRGFSAGASAAAVARCFQEEQSSAAGLRSGAHCAWQAACRGVQRGGDESEAKGSGRAATGKVHQPPRRTPAAAHGAFNPNTRQALAPKAQRCSADTVCTRLASLVAAFPAAAACPLLLGRTLCIRVLRPPPAARGNAKCRSARIDGVESSLMGLPRLFCYALSVRHILRLYVCVR